MYIFRFYLEKLTQLEKVSLTFSSDLWLRNDELTADIHILLITDPSNSCGVKDYKEVLQSRVLCFSSAWPCENNSIETVCARHKMCET